MRFLADAGVSPGTVAFLKQAGHDAVHVRELGMQRAMDQAGVYKYRYTNHANIGITSRSEKMKVRVSSPD